MICTFISGITIRIIAAFVFSAFMVAYITAFAGNINAVAFHAFLFWTSVYVGIAFAL